RQRTVPYQVVQRFTLDIAWQDFALHERFHRGRVAEFAADLHSLAQSRQIARIAKHVRVDFRTVGGVTRFQTEVAAAVRTHEAGIDGPRIRDGVLHGDFGDVRRFDVPNMKVRGIEIRVAFDEEVGLSRVGSGRNTLL